MNIEALREQLDDLQQAFRNLEQKLIEVAEVTPGIASANTPEFAVLVAVQNAETAAADMGRLLREMQVDSET